MQHYGKILSQTRIELDKKLGQEDKIKINAKMDKLPQYQDFKDLYNKTLPQIREFENKLYGQDSRLE